MIRVTPTLSLAEAELHFTFIKAGGPGGQNVNKLATAAQLRFNLSGAGGLSPAVKARVAVLAGRRLTSQGWIIITARRHRTQEDNRRDALTRLVSLLRQAAELPAPRRATRPTKGAVARRKTDKTHRSTRKAFRRPVPNA